MGKLLRFLDRLVDGFCNASGFLTLFLCLWVTFAVVMRYVFNSPIAIAGDTAIILAVFAFYLPIAKDLKEEIHPTISFITNKLSRRAQNLVQAFNLLVMIGLGTLWVYSFWNDMTYMLKVKVPIENMSFIRIGLVRIPMIVGMGAFVLLAIAYFGLTVRNLIKGRPADYSPSLLTREAKPKAQLRPEDIIQV